MKHELKLYYDATNVLLIVQVFLVFNQTSSMYKKRSQTHLMKVILRILTKHVSKSL